MQAETQLPAWQGFHHLALATSEFDATLDFYRDVLGMHIGELVPTAGQRGRHVFLKPGDTSSWGIHLWEHAGAPRRTPPAEWSVQTLTSYAWEWGALNHIAFALPDRAAADVLCARLERHGVRFSPPTTIGPICNVLFFDNNGIVLEATWPAEAEGQPPEVIDQPRLVHNMNDDPLEVVAAWQAAANARDAERLIELSDPEIELAGPRGAARGSELLRRWLERAGLELTTRRSWVSEELVVAEQHGVWRDTVSGEPLGEAELASVFRVAAGRVAYYARYDSLDQALAAAGIEDNDPRRHAKEREG